MKAIGPLNQLKLKKHSHAIVLLVVVYAIGTLGVFSGYYTAYHRISFQSQVKKVSQDQLEKLFFTEKDYQSIQWIDDESEFEWQGKMYDVSKISRTNDGYIIICEHDSLEEVLLALVNLTKGREQQGFKKGNPQPQFFQTLAISTSHRVLTSGDISLGSPESLYYSLSLEISSPPPRSVDRFRIFF